MSLRSIASLAGSLGIPADHLLPYGRDKAKVSLDLLQQPRHSAEPARLILVSAMTPTPAGEGKTTTSIGLGEALHAQGRRAALALREPSLGPVFGVKGGGTGGGRCRLQPSAEINLHFTGDLHAITAAHNLLAAMVDNHLHHGNLPTIDPSRVLWRRVMDMNDRALRQVVVALGGRSNGNPREAAFDITAASEVMAVLCLASDEADLRARLGRLNVGFSPERTPVTAPELGAGGALTALLRDALMPNLVQGQDGVPAFGHGCPFANIAHGTNSLLATRMALHTADWVVTEAGFGMDLGGEKYFDILCAQTELRPAAVVLVATLRALKLHGGVALAKIDAPDPAALSRGLPNLLHHVATVRRFGPPCVVAINRFPTDTAEELQQVVDALAEVGVQAVACDHYGQGGQGALALADAVVKVAVEARPDFSPLYDRAAPIPEKLEALARVAYGAAGVSISRSARQDIARIAKLGLSGLPLCVAKTQSSLTDTPNVLGAPVGHTLHVEGLREAAGAGFLVVMTGDIVRMPGLPKRPSALDVDVVDGVILGVE